MRGKPVDPDRPLPKPEELQPATDRLRVDFLNSEVRICFTFASLAETRLQAGERESAERSLADAERGYATLLRFLSDPKHADHISEQDRRDLGKKAEQLRSVLDGLKQQMSSQGGGERSAA